MLADVLDFLRCPHCGGDLAAVARSLRCGDGHVFDVARQGYVSLLSGNAAAGGGDTAAMVDARAAFLAAGHYAPIARAVVAAARDGVAQDGVARDGGTGCVVDLGAGTGYYLAEVLRGVPAWTGVALDVSKFAARRAARAAERMGAVVCDVWRALPVRTGTAALVLNVFAPRNAVEMRRIVRPDGMLVVVSPTVRHLGELVSTLGLLTVDEHKQQRLDDQLGPYFRPEGNAVCEYAMSLTHQDVEAVVGMGPSAWHTAADQLRERVATLPERVAVTASVSVWVYRPR